MDDFIIGPQCEEFSTQADFNACANRFHKTSSRVGDPVELDIVNMTYGFWDDTWSVWYGGYGCEEHARTALQEYCYLYLGC